MINTSLCAPIGVVNVEDRQTAASTFHLMIGGVRPVGFLDILQMLVQALSTSPLIGLNVDAYGDFMRKGALQEERNYSV